MPAKGLSCSIEKSLAYYRENPFSRYKERRRFEEQRFFERVTKWRDDYRRPGPMSLAEVGLVPRHVRAATLWDLVRICADFIVGDGISLALTIRAENRSLDEAAEILDHLVDFNLHYFVYEKVWEPLDDVPGVLRKWRALETIIFTRVKEDIHFILSHGRPDGERELERLTKAINALVARDQRAIAYRRLSIAAQSLEKSVGDIALLQGKDWVRYHTAEQFLGIGRRQLQRLIEAGALDARGPRYSRQVRVATILEYWERPHPNSPYVRVEK